MQSETLQTTMPYGNLWTKNLLEKCFWRYANSENLLHWNLIKDLANQTLEKV